MNDNKNFLDISDGNAMRKLITGFLRSSIAAHGPITLAWTGSASKRVYAGMKARAKEQRMFGSKSKEEAAPAPKEPDYDGASKLLKTVGLLSCFTFERKSSTGQQSPHAFVLPVMPGLCQIEEEIICKQLNEAILPVQQHLMNVFKKQVGQKLGYVPPDRPEGMTNVDN